MALRLGTFNLENLFGRYRFLDEDPAKRPKDYASRLQVIGVVAFRPGRSNALKPKAITEAQRKNTAATLLAAKPDILSVNEVENLSTLRIFNALYLKNYFDRLVMVQGNDPRGINVGLAFRRGLDVTVRELRTHADEAAAGGFLPTSNRLDTKKGLGLAAFSRDCLEVDVDVGTTKLTFLVNHLKAQEIRNGVDATTAKRLGQARYVATIVDRVAAQGRLPVVLGDLNKDVDGADYDGSLAPIATHPALADAFAAVPVADRWTHFYDADRSVSRLDYLWLPTSLASAITKTEVVRGGLSPRCTQFTGRRLGTIAKDRLEASDHCPVVVTLEV
jgi:endonuclease/exonuclease/phosphatase family metal-dependent hydrolase